MFNDKTMYWSMLAVVAFSMPVHADLISIAGSIGGELSGDAGNAIRSLSVGAGLDQVTAAQAGDPDEGLEASFRHEFDGEPERLFLTGETAVSRANQSEQATSSLSAEVFFAVSETASYRVTFDKNSEDGETAFFDFFELGGPSPVELFAFDGKTIPGASSESMAFKLIAGATYRLRSGLSASVPGLQDTDGSGSTYNLTVALVPEPAAAWLLIAGVGGVFLHRRVRRG